MTKILSKVIIFQSEQANAFKMNIVSHTNTKYNYDTIQLFNIINKYVFMHFLDAIIPIINKRKSVLT